MEQEITLGKIGEDIACEYLTEKSYRIIGRNYRKPWGEIDIIAKSKDGTLVFVEVKTLASGGVGALEPEDNVSSAKLKKLRRTCEAFVAKNPEFVDEKRGWRIDLVAISVKNPAAAELTSENCNIRYYENI